MTNPLTESQEHDESIANQQKAKKLAMAFPFAPRSVGVFLSGATMPTTPPAFPALLSIVVGNQISPGQACWLVALTIEVSALGTILWFHVDNWRRPDWARVTRPRRVRDVVLALSMVIITSVYSALSAVRSIIMGAALGPDAGCLLIVFTAAATVALTTWLLRHSVTGTLFPR
jgi:hypothetical protein